MEIPTYGRAGRRLGTILIALFFIPPAVVLWSIGPMQGQKVPDDMLVMMTALAIFAAGISLFLTLIMNVWVRVDASNGKVFRLHKLLGRTVRTAEFAVAQFDHISLHRAPRGSYMITLVGHERELVLRVTPDLKEARETAREAAECSGLELNDQL